MIDTMELGVVTAIGKGSAAAKEYLEGERLAKLLSNLQRGVQGPYFFGDKPSCVDFFWTNMNDWLGATFQDRLVSEFGGATITAAYPKLDSVLNGIRSLESYKACKIPIMREGFGAKDEAYDAWRV
jgi:glutathione S-transferase